MSVAFRRDSDEEHLEPKFERPIPAGVNLVTQRGMALIGQAIAALEQNLRAEPDEAAAAVIRRDLRYWQARQLSAEIAQAPDGSKVEFGVEVSMTLNGKPRQFCVVGDDEANPAAGLLSFKAPLVLAMFGAEVGETVAFGGFDDAIHILAIKVPPTD